MKNISNQRIDIIYKCIPNLISTISKGHKSTRTLPIYCEIQLGNLNRTVFERPISTGTLSINNIQNKKITTSKNV